jgi:hypothetical protein
MRPVETIPGMKEGRMMERMKSTTMYCRNFYKCHSVPPSKTMKKHSFLNHFLPVQELLLIILIE